jgi:hypothetical protein
MSFGNNGNNPTADIAALRVDGLLLRRDLVNLDARVEGEYRALRELMSAVSSETQNVLEQIKETNERLAKIEAAVKPRRRKR